MAVVINGTTGIDKVQDGSIVSADLDTNITVSGDLTVDTSTLKVDSTNNKVGVGTSSPATTFHAKRDNDNQLTATIENNGSATTGRHVLKLISSGTGSGTKLLELQSAGGSTTRLEVLADGRGLSQFTAKAWINFNGTSTVAIRDSHNVSSVTDTAQGNYRINYANALANTSYCPTIGNTADTLGNGDNRWILVVTSISTGYLDVVSTIIANGFNKQDKSHCLVTVFGD